MAAPTRESSEPPLRALPKSHLQPSSSGLSLGPFWMGENRDVGQDVSCPGHPVNKLWSQGKDIEYSWGGVGEGGTPSSQSNKDISR